MPRIARVVLRGEPDQLSDEEQCRAARFAAIWAQWLPYRVVQSATVFGGLLLVQVSQIVWPPRGVNPHILMSMSSLLIAFIVLASAALLPRTLVQARRARRWAAMHGAG